RLELVQVHAARHPGACVVGAVPRADVAACRPGSLRERTQNATSNVHDAQLHGALAREIECDRRRRIEWIRAARLKRAASRRGRSGGAPFQGSAGLQALRHRAPGRAAIPADLDADVVIATGGERGRIADLGLEARWLMPRTLPDD